jgi:hypothetical protein
MKIVCAWCGKKMGTMAPYKGKSRQGIPWTDEITHGMCKSCSEREKQKARDFLARWKGVDNVRKEAKERAKSYGL